MIIEKVLSSYIKFGRVICDLAEVEQKILDAHQPIEEKFLFLCAKCHKMYDDGLIDLSPKKSETTLVNTEKQSVIQTKNSNDIKIRKHVRNQFEWLIKKDFLSDEEINRLLDEQYSKSTFSLGFPFLRRQVDGRLDDLVHPRYYANIWVINGEEYYFCSQWFEKQRAQFDFWFNRIVTKENVGIDFEVLHVYSDKTTMPISDFKQDHQEFKYLHRIKLWANKPQQVNHKIIRAYLVLEKNGMVYLDNLRHLCSDLNSKYYVKKFNGNYPQMKTDKGHPHGKVFYDKDGIVHVYDVVRKEIKEWFGEKDYSETQIRGSVSRGLVSVSLSKSGVLLLSGKFLSRIINNSEPAKGEFNRNWVRIFLDVVVLKISPRGVFV